MQNPKKSAKNIFRGFKTCVVIKKQKGQIIKISSINYASQQNRLRQNQKPSFKARLPKNASVEEVIVESRRLLNKTITPPFMLKNVIKHLDDILDGFKIGDAWFLGQEPRKVDASRFALEDKLAELKSKVGQKIWKRAVFEDESLHPNVLKKIVKDLKSKDLDKQKASIKKLFELRAEGNELGSHAVDSFIWKKVVPFVKKSQNKELMDHVLNVSKKNIHSIKDLLERIKILEQLGHSKTHWSEARGYLSEERIPEHILNSRKYNAPHPRYISNRNAIFKTSLDAANKIKAKSV